MCKGERGKKRHQRASHPHQNQRSQACLQPSPDKREAFIQKARQLDEKALFEIERHRSIQDSHKFYKRLNDVRRPFEPQMAMSRAKNREHLTNKYQKLARWKQHFEEHLNEGSEQTTSPVDLRDDEIDFDLPTCEEIEGALRYLKNNKAAGTDSMVDKLLKNDGPNLVDALHAVIQQA
jgi:hypothetical protein